VDLLLLGIVDADRADAWFEPLTDLALAMIGFLLGQQLTDKLLRARGWAIVRFVTIEGP